MQNSVLLIALISTAEIVGQHMQVEGLRSAGVQRLPISARPKSQTELRQTDRTPSSNAMPVSPLQSDGRFIPRDITPSLAQPDQQFAPRDISSSVIQPDQHFTSRDITISPVQSAHLFTPRNTPPFAVQPDLSHSATHHISVSPIKISTRGESPSIAESHFLSTADDLANIDRTASTVNSEKMNVGVNDLTRKHGHNVDGPAYPLATPAGQTTHRQHQTITATSGTAPHNLLHDVTMTARGVTLSNYNVPPSRDSVPSLPHDLMPTRTGANQHIPPHERIPQQTVYPTSVTDHMTLSVHKDRQHHPSSLMSQDKTDIPTRIVVPQHIVYPTFAKDRISTHANKHNRPSLFNTHHRITPETLESPSSPIHTDISNTRPSMLFRSHYVHTTAHSNVNTLDNTSPPTQHTTRPHTTTTQHQHTTPPVSYAMTRNDIPRDMIQFLPPELVPSILSSPTNPVPLPPSQHTDNSTDHSFIRGQALPSVLTEHKIKLPVPSIDSHNSSIEPISASSQTIQTSPTTIGASNRSVLSSPTANASSIDSPSSKQVPSDTSIPNVHAPSPYSQPPMHLPSFPHPPVIPPTKSGDFQASVHMPSDPSIPGGDVPLPSTQYTPVAHIPAIPPVPSENLPPVYLEQPDALPSIARNNISSDSPYQNTNSDFPISPDHAIYPIPSLPYQLIDGMLISDVPLKTYDDPTLTIPKANTPLSTTHMSSIPVMKSPLASARIGIPPLPSETPVNISSVTTTTPLPNHFTLSSPTPPIPMLGVSRDNVPHLPLDLTPFSTYDSTSLLPHNDIPTFHVNNFPQDIISPLSHDTLYPVSHDYVIANPYDNLLPDPLTTHESNYWYSQPTNNMNTFDLLNAMPFSPDAIPYPQHNLPYGQHIQSQDVMAPYLRNTDPFISRNQPYHSSVTMPYKRDTAHSLPPNYKIPPYQPYKPPLPHNYNPPSLSRDPMPPAPRESMMHAIRNIPRDTRPAPKGAFLQEATLNSRNTIPSSQRNVFLPVGFSLDTSPSHDRGNLPSNNPYSLPNVLSVSHDTISSAPQDTIPRLSPPQPSFRSSLRDRTQSKQPSNTARKSQPNVNSARSNVAQLPSRGSNIARKTGVIPDYAAQPTNYQMNRRAYTNPGELSEVASETREVKSERKSESRKKAKVRGKTTRRSRKKIPRRPKSSRMKFSPTNNASALTDATERILKGKRPFKSSRNGNTRAFGEDIGERFREPEGERFGVFRESGRVMDMAPIVVGLPDMSSGMGGLRDLSPGVGGLSNLSPGLGGLSDWVIRDSMMHAVRMIADTVGGGLGGGWFRGDEGQEEEEEEEEESHTHGRGESEGGALCICLDGNCMTVPEFLEFCRKEPEVSMDCLDAMEYYGIRSCEGGEER